MLRTNLASLVKISVMGQIANPSMPGLPASPYLVSAEGEPLIVPAFGGLVYNVRVGDRAIGWAAELIQPGVSIKNSDPNANTALRVYACIGNRAQVMSGAASGATGTVIGKSGRFAEHVICDFSPADIEKMAPGDKVQVQAFGVGLKLIDLPEVNLMNCSPELLEASEISLASNGRLMVPVKGIAPSVLGGAGAGFSGETSVVNLQTSDPKAFADSGLADLRFGDLVAITDWDSRFGHGYLRGATGIGIVCQGSSFRSGYGPGMTMIMTGLSEKIQPEVRDSANIADWLSLC
jgi:hypothetical protein